MSGLLPINGGGITAALTDGTEEPLDAYRSMFAYVPQDFLLLSGTVLENITLFDEKPDMVRFEEVLSLTCLDEEVAKLPQGADTQLGEGGGRLSGGQRQRMAIARALYSDADVLLLDESTSALTVQMEETILQALRRTGKTVIVVTHRESAVALCDARCSIKDGKLINM